MLFCMGDSDTRKSLFIAGAGYLGRALAREALGRHWRVAALTRNAESAARLRMEGASQVIEDQLESEAWHGELREGPDFVVNCVSSAGGGLEGYRQSYLDGMQSLKTWLAGLEVEGQGPPSHLIYTGSTGVYMQNDGGWVEEGDAVDPDPTTRPGILREAEMACLDLPHSRCRVVLRLGGLYGPGRQFMIDQVRQVQGPLAGRGSGYLNLIHREDVVSAIFALFEANNLKDGEIFNLVDGHPATKAEMVGWLAGRLGLPDPGFDGQEPDPRRSRGGRSRRVSNRKLLDALEWHPQYPSYREGFGSLLEV